MSKCINCYHDLIRLQTERKKKTEEINRIDKKIDEIIDRKVKDGRPRD